MSTVKRLSLLLFCVALCFTASSCKAANLKNKKPETIDFSEVKKVQLVTIDDVYNILLSKSDSGCVNIAFLEEAPVTLLNMNIKIYNDVCEVKSDNIIFSTDINNFDNQFSPLIIYKFLLSTDFQNEQFTFNNSDGSYFLKKAILDKTVVFVVTPSCDGAFESYVLEIK